MFSPISPEFQYIIYKDREKELELAIQRRLAREARGEMPVARRAGSWYAVGITKVAGWLKERTAFHGLQKQVATEPARIEEPCPCSGVPC